jgi:arylsulfatase A-like enzyme
VARVRAFLLLAPLLAAASGGCSRPEAPASGGPRRIVVIVIDTLRADALPFYGADAEAAPFLAELAQRSLVFERAWAASTWTAPSTASIFTARYPNQHGVVLGLRARREEGKVGAVEINRLPESLETLPVFLRSRGYATYGASANVNVGPVIGFERGFDRFELLRYRQGYGAAALVDHVLEWKDELLAAPKSFLYLHVMDPHPPYERHARWMPADAPRPERALADRPAYASEIRFVDEALRRLFDELHLVGEAVVFLTADHGQEFEEHGGLGHGFQLYDELTHVPLLLHLPGPDAPRGHVARDVSNLDILPTLRFLLGAPPAPGEAGVSLLPVQDDDGASARPIFAMRTNDEGSVRADKRAVLRGREKLIVTEPSGRAELYDVVADPGERNDLAGARPERVRALRALLDGQARSAAASQRGAAQAYLPSREEARLLEELGYAEEAP